MYVLPFLAKCNSRVCLSETKLYTNLRFVKHDNAYIKKKNVLNICLGCFEEKVSYCLRCCILVLRNTTLTLFIPTLKLNQKLSTPNCTVELDLSSQ